MKKIHCDQTASVINRKLFRYARTKVPGLFHLKAIVWKIILCLARLPNSPISRAGKPCEVFGDRQRSSHATTPGHAKDQCLRCSIPEMQSRVEQPTIQVMMIKANTTDDGYKI